MRQNGRWCRRLHPAIFAWCGWAAFFALTLLASAATAATRPPSTPPPIPHSHVRQRQRRTESDNEEETFPVLIGLRRAYSRSSRLSVILRFSSRFPHRRFKRINVVSGHVTQAERDRLSNHPDIVYIEDDAVVYPNYVEEQVTSASSTSTADALLYGVSMVQGDSMIIPSVAESTATTGSTAACNDPNSFKIGVRNQIVVAT
jgi:Peptidase inhibitor I9